MDMIDDKNLNRQMNTLSETMNMLKERGYTHEFQMTDLGFTCKDTTDIFTPEDLTIKAVHRFEGESDPSDMSILYEIETNSGIKGIFLDAFGTYGSYDGQELAEFLKKVKREDNPSELHS